MSFSHDYPDDTHLTYTRSGNNAHLVLSFQSEDPDMGTEEMEYNSDGGESFAELLSDARSELTSYLDRQDTSSFYEQQGVSNSPGSVTRSMAGFTSSKAEGFSGSSTVTVSPAWTCTRLKAHSCLRGRAVEATRSRI